MTTAIITPLATTDAKPGDDKLTWWKQILPETSITYTDPHTGEDRTIQFDDAYFDDLIEAFDASAIDQLCVQVADRNNSHGPVDEDQSPEAQRAEVLEVKRVRPTDLSNEFDKPGLWGKVRFFNKKAARMVRDNPRLGVSARIREDWPRGDGKYFKRAMVHVLATIDPYNNGMSAWKLADMSDTDEVTLDLTNATYTKGKTVAPKKNGKRTDLAAGGGTATATVPNDLTKLSDEDLAGLAAELGLDVDEILNGLNDPDEDDDDEDFEEDAPPSTEVPPGTETVREVRPGGAGTSVDTGTADLSVIAQTALARANEAIAAGASTAWANEKDQLLRQGIPPAAIDLAAPYLSRPNGFTVDMSNDGGNGPKRADIAADMRKMLGHLTGYVDLAISTGHGGQFETRATEVDADKDVLDAWEKQTPNL